MASTGSPSPLASLSHGKFPLLPPQIVLQDLDPFQPLQSLLRAQPPQDLNFSLSNPAHTSMGKGAIGDGDLVSPNSKMLCSGLGRIADSEDPHGREDISGSYAIAKSRVSIQSCVRSCSTLSSHLPTKRLRPALGNRDFSKPLTIATLSDGTLLSIIELVWSGRPSYGENDGRRQLGELALVCRSWRDLAFSDEFWKPLCITRWPWLKSIKGGPAELLPPLERYKHSGQGRSSAVWHEFCLRQGRCMHLAGIGRRNAFAAEYWFSVEIYDRKGGVRLFASYGRANSQSQQEVEGRWLTKLAIVGYASCWHFSASGRDPELGRFESIQQYFERCHDPGYDHCLCTEVTIMDKMTGKMAILYASGKESKRKVAGERNETIYIEEELRPAVSALSLEHTPAIAAAAPPQLAYLAGSGIAVSKVQPSLEESAGWAAMAEEEKERQQKYRVDRLYLIFNTSRRSDVQRVLASLDWM